MSETTERSENSAANDSVPNGESATPEARLGEKGPVNATLSDLQRQRDEYLDLLQRSRAEFANYQKRSKAQADADRVYAIGSLARDLLDGLDNLERAAEALRAAGSAGVSEGIDMVHKQLIATLAKHGVEPIQALGKPFDPNEHEALVQQPDANHPEGTVVAELGKGYRIHERVLRPTKVAVSIQPAGSRSTTGAAGS